jgi:hemerythrin
MTLKSIEWKDSYNVGNALIDTHHRLFFELLKELNESLHADDATKLEDCIEFLTEYITMHLQVEEDLLAQANRPDLEMHIASHQSFATKILSLKNVYESNTDNFNPEDILQLMQNWFFSHILDIDKKSLSNL